MSMLDNSKINTSYLKLYQRNTPKFLPRLAKQQGAARWGNSKQVLLCLRLKLINNSVLDGLANLRQPQNRQKGSDFKFLRGKKS